MEKMGNDAEVLTADAAVNLLQASVNTMLTLPRDGSLAGRQVGRVWCHLYPDPADCMPASLVGHQTRVVAS